MPSFGDARPPLTGQTVGVNPLFAVERGESVMQGLVALR
jgi:hypothetical protein